MDANGSKGTPGTLASNLRCAGVESKQCLSTLQMQGGQRRPPVEVRRTSVWTAMHGWRYSATNRTARKNAIPARMAAPPGTRQSWLSRCADASARKPNTSNVAAQTASAVSCGSCSHNTAARPGQVSHTTAAASAQLSASSATCGSRRLCAVRLPGLTAWWQRPGSTPLPSPQSTRLSAHATPRAR